LLVEHPPKFKTQKGIDIHLVTAAHVCGGQPDEVTPDQRRAAKMIAGSAQLLPQRQWQRPGTCLG